MEEKTGYEISTNYAACYCLLLYRRYQSHTSSLDVESVGMALMCTSVLINVMAQNDAEPALQVLLYIIILTKYAKYTATMTAIK